MSTSKKIKHFKRSEVNAAKWDGCIDTAENGRIYAYSNYLDAMCTNWDALVKEDYEAIMPLPWRQKYGISYIYYPAFSAQLGIFGNKLGADLVAEFIAAIPKNFRYIDCPLNQGNVFNIASVSLNLRSNYVLDISRSYTELAAGYRENIRRNVKKATGIGCTVARDFPVQEVIALASKQSVQSFITEDDFSRFQRLFDVLKIEGKAVTYGVHSPAGELIASCVFVFSHHRAYYILVGNHPNGRTLGASHLLIDAFIREYSGQELKLDFEGSDVRNLAFFYSSFGAIEEKYAALRMNRLPRFLRWLKK